MEGWAALACPQRLETRLEAAYIPRYGSDEIEFLDLRSSQFLACLLLGLSKMFCRQQIFVLELCLIRRTPFVEQALQAGCEALLHQWFVLLLTIAAAVSLPLRCASVQFDVNLSM